MFNRLSYTFSLQTIFATCLAVLLAACATGPAQQEQTEPQQLEWPGPPEQARIRYLKSFDDFTFKDKKSIRDILLGEEVNMLEGLIKPLSVHSDGKRLFVADTGIRGLPVFDIATGRTDIWGLTGMGALKKTVGVTSDHRGQVYVSDSADHRVVVFDSEGNFINAFGGEEDLPGPAGLAFSNANDRLYVADSDRHQVLVYHPDGTLENVIGERGFDEGQFNFPTHIAVDGQGQLYVADSMNFRVQIYSASGALIRSFGEIGSALGTFNRLKGVAVDTEGHIYAVDASFNNFQIFDQDGNLLLFVGGSGNGPGQFYLPAGAHMDGKDRLFIADQYNRRVQMFQYLAGTTE